MINKLLTIISFALLVSCSTARETDSLITGYTLNSTDKTKVRLIDISTNLATDSSVIVQNRFQLNNVHGDIEPDHKIVRIGEHDQFNDIIVFSGRENIKINETIEGIFVETGSEHNQYKKQLDEKLKGLNASRSVHLKTMFALRNEGMWNDSLQNIYWGNKGLIKNIDQEISTIEKMFIKDNPDSYYSAYILNVYKTEYSPEVVEALYEKLDKKIKDSKYGKSIKTHLENAAIAVGEKFIDFEAKDAKGESKLFSSFFKGKYVLLDFSTPYCTWCLQSISSLQNLRSSVGDSLEIVSFYVDQDRNGLEKHLTIRDKSWETLWDGKGRFSDTYVKYRVFSTPTFYLFDNNGFLLKKWDGITNDFEKEVNQVIKAGR
jgi:thiol-disulfide isomerase/thioredoxin